MKFTYFIFPLKEESNQKFTKILYIVLMNTNERKFQWACEVYVIRNYNEN